MTFSFSPRHVANRALAPLGLSIERKTALDGAEKPAIRADRVPARENPILAPASDERETSTIPVKGLETLPGTPYSKYAVPIEYLPSRDYRARWGYSKPLLAPIHGWCEAGSPRFEDILLAMSRSVENLRMLPQRFLDENLPTPSWLDTPVCAFDALALYTLVNQYRPRTYLEIGSGISTCFAHRARVDYDLPTRIVSIDPEPRARVDAICDDIVRAGLETVDLAIFDSLEANDIVFFDGSHRSFMNSDVTVFMVEVLPRLKPGVIVHVHDVVLPWDYPDSFGTWYWNEQYLLAVYLIGNMKRVDPIFPTAFVCRDKRFDRHFSRPLIDLGDHNDSWRGGGSMWFTHRAA